MDRQSHAHTCAQSPVPAQPTASPMTGHDRNINTQYSVMWKPEVAGTLSVLLLVQSIFAAAPLQKTEN